ncbi:MAG: terminase small subunit, partial [Candidatus Competibacteraceae bacterium]|nr:terminase small subunit [Candidatus Competibacteraceae bacterium]
MALTAKQQKFVDEYLKSRNATSAALAAGYSERSAHSIGWENLRKPEIAEVISQRVTESAMSADEVL